MLNQRMEEQRSDPCRNVPPQEICGHAFYPLTVGPASISVAITLGANASHHARGEFPRDPGRRCRIGVQILWNGVSAFLATLPPHTC